MTSCVLRLRGSNWALKSNDWNRCVWAEFAAGCRRSNMINISSACGISPAPATASGMTKRLKSSSTSAGAAVSSSSAKSKSTSSPLLLSFKQGRYKLNLPLSKLMTSTPTTTTDRETAFSFHPDHSLDAVKASIREEGVGSVEFVGPGGETLPDESTISGVAWHGGFDIKLDGKQFPVLATRAGGYGDEDESAGGRTELASLLERGKVMRLRAALQDETRRSMTYTEFQDLCEDCGMDEADAQQVAADLHKVGVVLHFHKEPGLTDIVYLQPHQVLEHFFAEYNLDSPLRRYLLGRAETLEEQRLSVLRELTPTLALKEALERQVKRTVSRCMWGLSAVVASSAGGYWYLSYVYFSWDIMEPVTFFTALGVTTLSYAWWMMTNEEYQYSNVFEVLRSRMERRKFRSGGLNEVRLAQAQEELANLDEQRKQLQARIFELECMRDGSLKTVPLGPCTDADDRRERKLFPPVAPAGDTAKAG